MLLLNKFWRNGIRFLFSPFITQEDPEIESDNLTRSLEEQADEYLDHLEFEISQIRARLIYEIIEGKRVRTVGDIAWIDAVHHPLARTIIAVQYSDTEIDLLGYNGKEFRPVLFQNIEKKRLSRQPPSLETVDDTIIVYVDKLKKIFFVARWYPEISQFRLHESTHEDREKISYRNFRAKQHGIIQTDTQA